jgi:sn-glycerol 3-phosphate transport system substrate-binding protein
MRLIRARWWLLAPLVTLLTGGHALAATEIELWHGYAGAIGERFAELAQRFNASQTECTVKTLFNGSTTANLSAVIAAYRARRPPHMAMIGDDGTQVMLLSGAAVPVAKVLRDYGVTLEGGSLLDPVRACYVKDGQLHAMPFAATLLLLYYNKDVFRRAGLDPNRAPSTFAEVEAAATRVLATQAAKCGFTFAFPGILLEGLHAWHAQPLADQRDGIDGLATTLLLNGELGTRFWETLVRWQRTGLYTYAGRARQGEQLFTSGQCAITIAGASLIGALGTATFEWGAGRLPRMAGYPQGHTLVVGSALWVMAGHGPAEYRAVARFLEFLGRIDQQAWWHRVTGYTPTSLEVVGRLRAEGWFAGRPAHAAVLEQITGAERTGPARCFRIGNLLAIRGLFESELEVVLAGRKTPREGLDDAVQRGNDLLREFAGLYR